MKSAIARTVLPILGLYLGLAACGGSDSASNGSMYIESCSLGCSNGGTFGSLVTCGVHNISQNQDLGILFSKPVDISTVNDLTFQISDVQTGAFPAGQFVIDPHNNRRVVFRPLLDFDVNGNALFGFDANHTYQLYIKGSKQGDNPPLIESVDGKQNLSSMSCTITTDQPVTDPVPGPPTGQIFVDTLTGTNQPANNAVDVLTTSKITFVFNDIMDIGTLVVAGQAPFITVAVDTDGNVLDPTDQVLLAGSYTYFIDPGTLSTTLVFTSATGLPGKGSDPNNPRRIVVTMPSQISDLAGNNLSNPGQTVFTTVGLPTAPQTLPPPDGEYFVNTALRDSLRTGAEWGTVTSGRLTPGLGGGSGRLGDLVVKSGQQVTLITSAIKARGSVTASNNPKNNDTISFNGATPFDFSTGVATGTVLGNGHIAVENHSPFINYSLTELVNYANASSDPLLQQASYWVENSNTIVVQAKTGGSAGNAITILVTPFNPANNVWSQSGPTLAGGLDDQSFPPYDELTNFDFSTNPGQTPPGIVVDDGIFEFDYLKIEGGGRLKFVGDNPARLLVRGQALVQGTIDVAGLDPGDQFSSAPLGQVGGAGGPDGGDGGIGGDRRDCTGSNLVTIPPQGGLQSAGVQNPGAFIQGTPGGGVGKSGLIGAGPGGVQWPQLFPITTSVLNNLATDPGCSSEQVAGPGGGGAYATDGQPGIPLAINAVSSQGTSNTPASTPGGDNAPLGLEPPGAPPVIRKLTPKKGYLRGGAGGGGGGTSTAQTSTNSQGFPDLCTGAGAVINLYRDQSAAGGGGAGGALQLQAGALAQIDGVIDAGGGDGGSAQPPTAQVNDQQSAPGGGGSGGAVLLQAKLLQFSSFSPPRIDIAGGFGGSNNTGSVGGDGSAGLLRLEAKNPLDMTQLYTLFNPIDVPPAPSYNTFATTGTWTIERTYPDALSGAASCWFRPVGITYFSLLLEQDLPPTLGWDMDIVRKVGSGTQTVSYREPGNAPGQLSWEEYWGTNIAPDVPPGQSAAPVAVRFQGARLSQTVTDLCSLDVNNPSTGIAFGSVSPWVQHPADLNSFTPRPEIIRFVVIFDASHPDFKDVLGVTHLRLTATPD